MTWIGSSQPTVGPLMAQFWSEDFDLTDFEKPDTDEKRVSDVSHFSVR